MADTKKILDFLSANVKNYSEGVELIAEFGSPTMAASYRNASPRFHLQEVLSLLRRLAGIPLTDTAIAPSTSQDTQPDTQYSQPSTQKPQPKYPNLIQKAKSLLHELYLSMVDYQKRLIDLGDANTDELCSKRVSLMKERQPVIDSFVELNDLVNDYFATDSIPDRLTQLVASLSADPNDTVEPSSEKSLDSLSDLDLEKYYKQVKSKINRRQRYLRYQCYNSTKTLNPMPDSPARRKIESEIESYKAELQLVIAEEQRRGLK